MHERWVGTIQIFVGLERQAKGDVPDNQHAKELLWTWLGNCMIQRYLRWEIIQSVKALGQTMQQVVTERKEEVGSVTKMCFDGQKVKSKLQDRIQAPSLP